MNQFDAVLAIGATTVLLLGVVSGYVRNRLWISERVSGLTASVALALATVAWVHLIGSSGILAAFVAGLSRVERTTRPSRIRSTSLAWADNAAGQNGALNCCTLSPAACGRVRGAALRRCRRRPGAP